MSYTLQAIVGASDVMEIRRIDGLAYAALTDRLVLVPLNRAVRERFDIPALPLTDEDEKPALPESLGSLCGKLSKEGTVAYLEAQYFGGAGLQAHVLFRQGAMIGEPVRRSGNSACYRARVPTSSMWWGWGGIDTPTTGGPIIVELGSCLGGRNLNGRERTWVDRREEPICSTDLR